METFPVRCPICHHVLFLASGWGGPPIEIKCHHCDVLVRWPGKVAEIVEPEEVPEPNNESPSA